MTTALSDVARATGRPDFGLAARLWGTVSTLLGLALAFVTGLALDRLASHHLDVGLGLLAGVVVARGVYAEILDRWFTRVARRLRRFWRASVVTFFLVPDRASGSPVEIASAIETIVDEPRLAVVRASAQASVLALVVIVLCGGWQALGIVLALLAVAVPLYQRAGRRAAVYDTQYQERRRRLAQRQLDLLTHAPELRALGAVSYGAREIAALSVAEHLVALRAIRSALGSSLVTEFLGGVSVGLVAMDVGFGLLDGRVSLLRAGVCVLATAEFFAHVRRYGVEFHRREAILSAHQRLTPPPALESGDTDDVEVLDAVDLVTLALPTPVTLSVARGDRVAITGASGIGKTTLVHTLLGWREARSGTLRRTRDAVAYVSAETSLVDGSLGDNLRLGLPVRDDHVLALLASLGLVEQRFSDLDTVVSADGEGFSSGERVRLLIARALLQHPRLLILDDVAGLLDVDSTRAVRQELGQHPELAIIEVAVDDTLFISATTRVGLS